MLYKTAIVFPSAGLQNAASPSSSYTLPAGSHEYPFRFKIPFNNNCAMINSKLTNLNVAGLRLEMARDTNRHVKKTLPPSLTGFAGQAEIRYYVKVTVQRPAFYKENFRAVCEFLPYWTILNSSRRKWASIFCPLSPLDHQRTHKSLMPEGSITLHLR